jgi:hypothetical protein
MWFEKISSFSILIPLLLGLIFIPKLKPLQKAFLLFIVFSGIVECITSYAFSIKMNNLWMFKIFLICDFLFFVWFFNETVKFPKWKWAYTLAIIPILILNEFVFDDIYGTDMSTTVFYFMIFLYSVIQSGFIIINVFDDFEVNILNNFVFWIAMARVFYHLIVVFIYVYPNFVENKFYNEFYGDINFTINATGNIVLNILYGISFVCQKTKN